MVNGWGWRILIMRVLEKTLNLSYCPLLRRKNPYLHDPEHNNKKGIENAGSDKVSFVFIQY